MMGKTYHRPHRFVLFCQPFRSPASQLAIKYTTIGLGVDINLSVTVTSLSSLDLLPVTGICKKSKHNITFASPECSVTSFDTIQSVLEVCTVALSKTLQKALVSQEKKHYHIMTYIVHRLDRCNTQDTHMCTLCSSHQ